MQRALAKLLLAVAMTVFIALIIISYFTALTTPTGTEVPYSDVADAVLNKLVYSEGNTTIVIPNVRFQHTVIRIWRRSNVSVSLKAEKTTAPNTGDLLRIFYFRFNVSQLSFSGPDASFTPSINITRLLYYYETAKNLTYLYKEAGAGYAYLTPHVFVHAEKTLVPEKDTYDVYVEIRIFIFEKIIYMGRELDHVELSGIYNVKFLQYTENAMPGFYTRSWLEEPDDLWIYVENTTSYAGMPLTDVVPGDVIHVSLHVTRIIVELEPVSPG